MYSHSFCILCVTETWLSDFISDGEILPTDYILYRKDRPSRGGGVMIAVRSSLLTSIILSPSDLEVVCIKIGLRSDSLVICCVYVPPDIDWSVLMGTLNQSNCFCNFIFDCNLTQHVFVPTHIKGNLLDLVLSSPSISINHLIVHPLSVVNFSDHHAISFSVCCNVSSAATFSPGYVF